MFTPSKMPNLARFNLSDLIVFSAHLRQLHKESHSMEEVAQKAVTYFYENLIEQDTGGKCCVLVRFFKTHPYGELTPELQAFARNLLQKPPQNFTKCLTLLGTFGQKPEWNHRTQSNCYQAIPLEDDKNLEKLPMFLQLFHQLELPINTVINPHQSTLLLDLEQKNYNLFYVSEAMGSAYVPAQENFVIPFGIKSVLGFGGFLPSSCDLFALIIFSNVFIPPETAKLFKPLAMSIKLSLLPFVGKTIFNKT